jgi:hypothetical protein
VTTDIVKSAHCGFREKLVQTHGSGGILWRASQKLENTLKHSRSLLSFLMLLATILGAPTLVAGPTATLTGRVTDTSGAVITAVKVEATNVETNVISRRDECERLI